jgi:hypothetical protein
MIYFAQADVSGQIKIGYHGGTDANDRLRELQTGCPTKLILLGTIPGEKETEADLHRRFAFAHAHGEWFNPVPELLAFIGAQGKGPSLGKVGVESRFVQIKVLTIGSKQVSQAFFRQLPCVHIIDPNLDLIGFRGTPWGQVNYSFGACERRVRFGHLHLVWEGDGCLFRSCVERVMLSKVSYAPSRVNFGARDPRAKNPTVELSGDQELVLALSDQFTSWFEDHDPSRMGDDHAYFADCPEIRAAFDQLRDLYKQLEALDQLFIGV